MNLACEFEDILNSNLEWCLILLVQQSIIFVFYTDVDVINVVKITAGIIAISVKLPIVKPVVEYCMLMYVIFS